VPDGSTSSVAGALGPWPRWSPCCCSATIDIYLDLQCPACKTFEERADPTIDELVAAGQAKVVYHPVAYLDRFSSTRYASRAAQASGCAADVGVFPAYLDLLFAEQPAENSAGLFRRPAHRTGARGRGPGVRPVRAGRAVRRLDEVGHRGGYASGDHQHAHRAGQWHGSAPHRGRAPGSGRRRRMTGRRVLRSRWWE
jgi:hypothetical protein